ncbi:acyl-CoA dehydrogenase family protein [Mycobacterium sp. 1245801.1]|uniref:acyl-CoA dehydrogenase family protein n=1 Tax=Mycobacterium sp. 1245801.1 TaxID=1834075 RepID=UPI000800391F|nr:acyl-CoA dehydrogenase family protein [Mycobacterium sp. 1245801.1]OBJ13317.1 DNA alkylation response protein [Mycobacterium sp. 1245801.1]
METVALPSDVGRLTYDPHRVTNQPPPLRGYNLASYPALREALIREGGGWGIDEVTTFGAVCGSPEIQRCSELADRNRPILHTHDQYGHRIDEVEYDPSYHQLMALAVANGLHAAPWRDPRPGAHVVRAAKTSVWAGDQAILCPIWMTYVAIPSLRHAPDLAAIYEPLLSSRTYVPGLGVPSAKRGITAGMSMTEKQGGSDLRAVTTEAVPNGDGSFSITGHKWFTSAPMSDIFLVVAQAPGGISCFLLPRVLPDGSRNRMYLQRLKNKLGNHANASSEVEYDRATAWLIGEEGRGVATIMEMVSAGRLEVATGSATLIRVALTRAVHHAQYRHAFGAALIEQPLMRNVLADLAVEVEAATMVTMRLAGAADNAIRGDLREGLLRRIGVAAVKYWVCKRATQCVGEAMECLGGNGYIEDSGMPRLFREAPLAGIWEGSANITALDTLRALDDPSCMDVLIEELAAASGADSRLDDHVQKLHYQLLDRDAPQYMSRLLAQNICLALQGSLLVRHGNSAVAEAFLASRLERSWGGALGTLPRGLDLTTILKRTMPMAEAS